MYTVAPLQGEGWGGVHSFHEVIFLQALNQNISEILFNFSSSGRSNPLSIEIKTIWLQDAIDLIWKCSYTGNSRNASHTRIAMRYAAANASYDNMQLHKELVLQSSPV